MSLKAGGESRSFSDLEFVFVWTTAVPVSLRSRRCSANIGVLFVSSSWRSSKRLGIAVLVQRVVVCFSTRSVEGWFSFMFLNRLLIFFMVVELWVTPPFDSREATVERFRCLLSQAGRTRQRSYPRTCGQPPPKTFSFPPACTAVVQAIVGRRWTTLALSMACPHERQVRHFHRQPHPFGLCFFFGGHLGGVQSAKLRGFGGRAPKGGSFRGSGRSPHILLFMDRPEELLTGLLEFVRRLVVALRSNSFVKCCKCKSLLQIVLTTW